MKTQWAIIFVFLSFTASADEILTLNEWKQKSPLAAAALNIHTQFEEPTIKFNNDGVIESKKLEMVIYSAQSKVVANIDANNIKFESLIQANSFSLLDPAARHIKIGPNQAMPVVAGKNGIQNFNWCNRNPKDPDIFLPQLELSQTHMSRPGEAWCTKKDYRACYESCRLIPSPSALLGAVVGYNQLKKIAGKHGKDLGMATQSELNYYNENRPFQMDLARLTKVNTPVKGVLEINIFYINQILVFGKILVVFQPSPADPRKTIVSALSAFAVRSDAWNHKAYGTQVKSILASQSSFNDKTGILAGIPKFTNYVASSLAKFAESNSANR